MTPKLQHKLLLAWHAWVAGGFLVAYLTADEDTYAMHVFSGYAVLAAIVLRIAVGVAATGLWRLPRPALALPLKAPKGRHPLFAQLAAALLALVGLAAATGAVADFATWMEDPHEAIAEASLWVIFAHVAFVAFMYGGKRLLARLLPPVAKEAVR